jgi:hypothetical protein
MTRAASREACGLIQAPASISSHYAAGAFVTTVLIFSGNWGHVPTKGCISAVDYRPEKIQDIEKIHE